MVGCGLGKWVGKTSLSVVEDNWRELAGLRVKVNEVVYVASLDAPADKPYPFVYFIEIVNDSEEQVVIYGRKWVVRDHDGSLLVLEGEGVVGQRPDLPPGERFSYNSYHVMAGSGTAWGAFYGVTKSGEQVRVEIPKFAMDVPEWVE